MPTIRGLISGKFSEVDTIELRPFMGPQANKELPKMMDVTKNKFFMRNAPDNFGCLADCGEKSLFRVFDAIKDFTNGVSHNLNFPCVTFELT